MPRAQSQSNDMYRVHEFCIVHQAFSPLVTWMKTFLGLKKTKSSGIMLRQCVERKQKFISKYRHWTSAYLKMGQSWKCGAGA